MSESIDRRVVEMRFDNKDFEQNVNTTMTVLEKLKEKLSFKGAGEKFEAASGLGSAIDSVKNRFSALEVVGMTALVNLTNSAVNLGKRLAKSFTIDQVRAGFSEYELKMNSIQTIMASTGADINTVNGYLNELNTYADKTIYSFSDMTASIGKFTNAGVDLDTAVKAIQGISNEAAVSGANANEASRAMYNFAQALSAGYVKLIDWKSIENANMATKEFKQQLIDTAVEMGNLEKNSDGTYKVLTEGANGAFKENITATKNFNDSLSAAWMTTDVLTTTLGRYADATTGIGKKAFAAAQDVKTFTQLIDTVKEAIGSGWAQTFEIIFGNLEEAKELWTGVNNVISGFVDRTSTARNTLLQGWKDYKLTLVDTRKLLIANAGELGKVGDTARDVLIKAIGNTLKGFANLVSPIKDAFSSVFSPITSKQLVDLTLRFAVFSQKFSDTMKVLGRNLSLPFIDIFKAGKDVIDLLKDAFSGLLEVIGGNGGESAIISWVTVIANFIAMLARGTSSLIAFARATGIFTVIQNALFRLNDILFALGETAMSVMGGIEDAASPISTALTGIAESTHNLLSQIDLKPLNILNKIAGAVGKLFSLIGTGISRIDFAKLGGLLAGGGILAAGLKISKLAGTISDKLENLFGKGGKEGGGGLLDGVKETLSTLSDTLNQFQASLKIGQLVTIAISIGILAASCATLADIPAKKLAIAVGAVGGLFGELAGASHLMSGAQTKGIIAMSVAVVILAKAVKKMSEIKDMGKGLLGVGAILGELTAFCLIFDKMKIRPKSLTKTGEGLILMAVAINLLAKPIKELGALDTGQLIQGLLAMAAMLGGFTLTALAFSKIKTKGLTKAGAAMVIMAVAMRMLVKPLSELGAMDLTTLAKGLGAMGVALLELAGFTFIMSKIAETSGSIMKASAALLVMSIGIKIMASAISQMSSTENVGQGLSVLFGSLLILGVAMAAMQNSLAGAAAMIVVAGALTIMAPAIALLSSLNFAGVVTGLVALAGTLAVFGVGAALLAPVIPVMIGLGAAMALLGVGVLSLGAGMTMLVAAFAMATGPIINGAKALAEAFPIMAKGIGDGFVELVKAVGNGADALKDAFVQIIESITGAINESVPMIVTCGLELLMALLRGIDSNISEITATALSIITKFIDGISEGLPALAESGINLIISLLNSMATAISDNGDRLANAFANVLLAALGAIVGLIPGFGKKGKALIDEYRKGFEDKESKRKLDKSSKEVASSVEKNVKVADQYANGQNVTRGLEKGLSSCIPSLRSTAQTIADIVDKTVRKKNEIKSPSRRLRRTGIYLMEGLISGVDSLTGQYERQADNIATVMIASANRSVNSVNDIMSTGLTDSFDFNGSVDRAVNVSMSMDKFADRNAELNDRISKLTNSISSMTDTMNSRSLNVYNTIDGASDPTAFADELVRSFRLNARTV